MKTLIRAVLGLLVIGVIVSLVTLYHGDEPVGSENVVGRDLPDFAAPLASGTQNADSNVYTPQQAEAARSIAACDVKVPGAFNSCRDLAGRAVLAFWNTTKPECARYAETLDRFAGEHQDVKVAAVAFDESEQAVREFVAAKSWTLPVPIDRDGAVATLYAVAGCPTTFFAESGKVTAVKLGVLSAQQLARGAGVGASSGGGR